MRAVVLRVLVCLSSILIAGGVQAHSWYPAECCDGRDCSVLPDDAVHASREGWMLRTTGETIPFDDVRVLKSPDGRFHQCIFPAERHTTQCLFVPAAGM